MACPGLQVLSCFWQTIRAFVRQRYHRHTCVRDCVSSRVRYEGICYVASDVAADTDRGVSRDSTPGKLFTRVAVLNRCGRPAPLTPRRSASVQMSADDGMPPTEASFAPLIRCHDCDLLQRIRAVPAGATAKCPRCGSTLFSVKPDGFERAFV